MSTTPLKARLTKRFVDSAAPTSEGEFRIWDASVRGVFLRVWPGGRKTYCLKARANGVQRWVTIGEHGTPWTPEMARDKALDLITALNRGEDPSAILGQAATTDTPSPSIVEPKALQPMTISELFDLYLREGPQDKPLKRESSWGVDRSCYWWIKVRIGPGP